eukprot:3935210-Rhodomonas_salina.1
MAATVLTVSPLMAAVGEAAGRGSDARAGVLCPMPCPVLAYECRIRCSVLPYAMYGTGIRVPDAVSGTDIRVSSTDRRAGSVSYACAVQCPLLSNCPSHKDVTCYASTVEEALKGAGDHEQVRDQFRQSASPVHFVPAMRCIAFDLALQGMLV